MRVPQRRNDGREEVKSDSEDQEVHTKPRNESLSGTHTALSKFPDFEGPWQRWDCGWRHAPQRGDVRNRAAPARPVDR